MQKKVGYLDASYDFIDVVTLPADAQTPLSMDWVGPQCIGWVDNTGFYSVDIETANVIMHKQTCENSILLSMSAHPDRNGTCLIDQFHYWPVDDESTYNEQRIYTYDIASDEQHLLNIAEQE